MIDLDFKRANRLPGHGFSSNPIREALWDLEDRGILLKLSEVVGIDHEEGYKRP